jgi:hypothetical protein
MNYIGQIEARVKRANLRRQLYPHPSDGGCESDALEQLASVGRIGWVPPGPTWLGGWFAIPHGAGELTQGSSAETV